MSGTFGYELDLGKLSDGEKEEIKEQIARYHKYAPLIQNGLYYRLTNPFEDEVCAWEYLSEDRGEVLVNAVMQDIHGNMNVNYIRLKGLREDARYREQESGKVYAGAALMEAGLPLPVETGEYRAYQLHFVEVS